MSAGKPGGRLDRFVRRARAGEGGAARLGPGNIYILPTGQGLLYAILVAALLVAAVNYANNLVFGLTFLLAGIGIAAMIQTWRNLSGLEIRIGGAEPVFAGEIAQFPVQLHNRRGADRFALRLKLDRDSPLATNVAGSTGPHYVRCAFKTRERGWCSPERLDIETRFPSGLFRAWSVVAPQTKGLVYPAPMQGVPRPSSALRSVGGSVSVLTEEGNDDFTGLRAYRAGEPLYRVSWKATARTGDLHSKLFGAEADVTPRISWSDVPATNDETRLRILTGWVVETSAAQAPFSFHLPGLDTDTDIGETHLDFCLRELALYGKER